MSCLPHHDWGRGLPAAPRQKPVHVSLKARSGWLQCLLLAVVMVVHLHAS